MSHDQNFKNLILDYPRQALAFHRLVHYCLDLGELYETDRVVPVVIFLRGQAPRRELVFGTERHTYLHFNFIACELGAIAYERFRDSNNIVARLNLPNMRYAPGRKIDVYAHAVRGLLDLEDNPEKRLKGTLKNSRCLCRTRKPRYVRVRNSMIIKAFEKRDL